MSKEQRMILRIALEGMDVSDDSGAGESLHSLGDVSVVKKSGVRVPISLICGSSEIS